MGASIKFLLFRAKILTDLTFDELRCSFSNKIGLRFFKGNIEKDFISLFYIFPSGFYRKTQMEVAPSMQFTIDKLETKNGKQIILFKRANFASIFILVLIVGINIFTHFVAPIGLQGGAIISVIIYVVTLGIFNQQYGQFKEELKLIERELKEENEN